MNEITYAGKHSLMHRVSRHAHESWEFIYCTYGGGQMLFDERVIPYGEGDVLVIPPMIPHMNVSESGFQNYHLNMRSPTLALKEPTLIRDDSNRFLLDAFTAAFSHFYSNRPERSALLAAYGDVISCTLAAYQTVQPRSEVVEAIEDSILANYSDCSYELDTFLRSLPFSNDYVRKLFQKELGVTPHQFLTAKRLQMSAVALSNAANESASMAEIAVMCGFRDPLYFSRMFKKKYGVAPSYYLQSMRSGEPVRPDGDSLKVMLESE